jgi:membrane protein
MIKRIEERLKKIPVLGWLTRKSKGIILPGMDGLSLYDLWELYTVGIAKGAFSTRASAISFDFFMAIFPFLLFLLNLIPFIWFIEDFQLKLIDFIDRFLPPQTAGFFNDIFYDIANTPRAGLLSFVFILSVYLMANGINGVFTGFKSSYHTHIVRGFWRQYIVATGVSVIVALLLLITVIATVYLTYMIENLWEFELFQNSAAWVNTARYLVFVVMIYIGVATMYFFGTREGRKSRFFSVGALFTTLLIMLTTFLFGVYITNFSSYNELYGSIGALLILMVYIWLNANILLLGFELNAVLNRMRRGIKN